MSKKISTYLCLVPIPSEINVLRNFPSMNIFVAKLNFKTSQQDLEAAFAKFGEVTSVKIIRDKETGRSKGYGFIDMPNEAEANSAIEGLNEKELDGRQLVVKPGNANPRANNQ